MTTDRAASAVFGIVLMLVGGFYIARNLFGVDLSWSTFWPVIVIAIGLGIVLTAMRRRV